MGLTEVTAGIPYPACPMEVVKAEIEPAWRRHLALSGELVDAAAARAHGLIDEIVAPEGLLPRAVDLARARNAAPAYARVKAQLKADALARMGHILDTACDPMLESWV
jgi:enoyl-CoA hydratase